MILIVGADDPQAAEGDVSHAAGSCPRGSRSRCAARTGGPSSSDRAAQSRRRRERRALRDPPPGRPAAAIEHVELTVANGARLRARARLRSGADDRRTPASSQTLVEPESIHRRRARCKSSRRRSRSTWPASGTRPGRREEEPPRSRSCSSCAHLVGAGARLRPLEARTRRSAARRRPPPLWERAGRRRARRRAPAQALALAARARSGRGGEARAAPVPRPGRRRRGAALRDRRRPASRGGRRPRDGATATLRSAATDLRAKVQRGLPRPPGPARARARSVERFGRTAQQEVKVSARLHRGASGRLRRVALEPGSRVASSTPAKEHAS